MANCTHPAICNGICLVCGEKAGKQAAEPQKVETPAEPQEAPEKAQETPKKATRKRKA